MKISLSAKALSNNTPTLEEGKPALLSTSGKVSGHMILSFPTDKPVREASTPPMQWDPANGREDRGERNPWGKEWNTKRRMFLVMK